MGVSFARSARKLHALVSSFHVAFPVSLSSASLKKTHICELKNKGVAGLALRGELVSLATLKEREAQLLGNATTGSIRWIAVNLNTLNIGEQQSCCSD